MQRNTTQMKEQARNTEFQRNEKEIGKPSKHDQKTMNKKRRKCKNQ